MIGKIYFIKCRINIDFLYIGITTTNINNELNYYLDNNLLIFYMINKKKYKFYIELYKEYDILDRNHLLVYKQLVINKSKNKLVNNNDCLGLNKLKPNYLRRCYQNKNRDRIRKYGRKYYFDNKNKIKKHQQNYINKNKNKYQCNPCNLHTYSSQIYNRHITTKKHIKNISMFNFDPDETESDSDIEFFIKTEKEIL